MGISFDYDFGTREVLVYDAPRGSTVIVDDVKYVPERTCTRGDEFWECSECGLHGLHDEWRFCPNCGAKVVE